MNTRNGFFDVNGARIFYEIAGKGQTVVLIHGFTLDTRMWNDQFIPLAEHYQVIRYDLRGFGQSSVPTNEPYTHYDDLKVLLDRLNIQQAHFVGLSKGGGVAIDFAISYPDRVLDLVLIDSILSGYPWSVEGTARNALIWQAAREGGIPAAKQSWLSHPLFVPTLRQAAIAERLTQIIDTYSGWHFVNEDPEQGLEPPAAQQLAELTMNIFVMVGEMDTQDFLQIAEIVSQQAPHTRKMIIPGVGHMANMEAPQLVTDAIIAYLAR